MGTYIPAGPKRKRSLSDTLAEAEEEHFLDCPDAEFRVRAAAFLLDAILCFLLLSGIQHLGSLAVTYLPRTPGLGSLSSTRLEDLRDVVSFTVIALKFLTALAYLFWSVSILGGTPAKLMLGLRVVDSETGKFLPGPRVFLREFIGKLASIGCMGAGFILPLFRKDSKALHDLLSKSVVKRIHGGS